jgi:hypothetical protein
MDQIDINDTIFDLSVVLNKLASAKKDSQRHLQGLDDPDNLAARVDRLEDSLTDVAWEIDSVRDDLFKLIDKLEEKKFKMDMDQLSRKVKRK